MISDIENTTDAPWFLWDEPVDWKNHHTDGADIMPIEWVDRFARSLPNKLDKGPLAIAIYGPWGSGKTTILKKIRHPEQKNTVWFEPWRFENENNLMIPLLAQMTADLSRDLKGSVRSALIDTGKNLLGRATKFAVRQGINWAVSASGAGMAIDAIGGQASKLGETIVGAFVDKSEWGNKKFQSEVSAFRADFQSMIKTAHDGNTPVYIMIDDLDRCSHVQVLRLLEAIKNFLWEPNVIFVLALDREQVINAVAHSLRQHIHEDENVYLRARVLAVRYLEKFFLHTIDIGHTFPDYKSGIVAIRDRMKEEIEGHLTDAEKDPIDLDLVARVFRHCEPNLRQIKRIARWVYFEARHRAHSDSSFGPALAEFALAELHTELWLGELHGHSDPRRKRYYGVLSPALSMVITEDNRVDASQADKALGLLDDLSQGKSLSGVDPYFENSIKWLNSVYAGIYLHELLVHQDHEQVISLGDLVNEAVKL